MICIFFSENEGKYCELDYNKIMKCNTVKDLENHWEDDGLSEGAVTTIKKRFSKQNDPFFFFFLTRKNFSESESKSVTPLITIRRTAESATDIISSNKTPERFTRNDNCAKNVFRPISSHVELWYREREKLKIDQNRISS